MLRGRTSEKPPSGGRGLAMNSLRVVKGVKSLQRLRRIVTVLTQHGFGHVVDRLSLGRLAGARRWRRAKAGARAEPMSVGERLAAVCSDLGPTFIKLAQMATTRPDFLPADVLEDLKALQDHVPAFDSQLAIDTIREDLGSPVEELFASFDESPIASGSISQVHRATAQDGMEVVVKVRRPRIEETIQLDLFLLKTLAEAMENLLPELRVYRPATFVDEFERALIRELDFTQEGSSTARVQLAFEDDPHIHIPRTRWDLSSSRVLTLEVVGGKNIGVVLASPDARINRKLLASRLASLYVKQFFEVGIFHADPHPGNILASPPAEISLIDFGQIGVVSDELAAQMVGIIVGAIYRETDLIVSILDDLNALGPETDARELARDLRVLQDKYYGLPLKRLDLVTIFQEATEVMRRRDVAIPRELVLVLKTLTTAMGIVLQLDPELDLVALFRPRVKQLIKDRLSPNRLARSAGLTGWHLAGLIREAPQQMRSALRRIAKGQWQLNVRHERLDQLLNELDRSSNRLSFAVVIGAIVMGSSMVITADPGMEVLGVPLRWFGVVGYLLAGVLGVGLLWAIFRSGRLS